MTNRSEEMVMNNGGQMVFPPQFESVAAERADRKRKLVGAFRLFGKFGFDEGVAGHITARDPEFTDTFWVNPMGVSFKHMKVSHLIRVDHNGNVVEGQGLLNRAAFTIHAAVHKARPRVTCAAHTHSVYGKAWSALHRPLDPITQDACAFFNTHAVFDDFTGVVVEGEEGQRIADALGDTNKAAILANHGLITVGTTVESAAWWYITMERSCQAQLAAEAAGKPTLIAPEYAAVTQETVGSELAGWFSFKPLFDVISAEQPDMFE